MSYSVGWYAEKPTDTKALVTLTEPDRPINSEFASEKACLDGVIDLNDLNAREPGIYLVHKS